MTISSSTRSDDEVLLEDYLSGRLSEDDRNRFEEAYFNDDRRFEALCAYEDELLCRLARGELPADLADRLTRRYAGTPGLRARLELAADLRALSARRIETLPRHPAAWWRLPPPAVAALAASLALVAGVGWWFARAPDSPPRLTGRVAEPAPDGDRSAGGRVAAGAPVALTLSLAPGVTRSAAPVVIVVSRDVQGLVEARLRVDTADRFEGYRVELQPVGGAPLWEGDGTLADGRVGARFPVTLLSRGDYLLRLRGTTASGQQVGIDSYSFTVER